MKKLLCIAFVFVLLLTGCTQNHTDGVPIQTQAPIAGQPSIEPSEMLTPQEAEAAALEYAGLTAEDVIGLHATIEIENGIPYYEVEFRSGHMEYDCLVNAETGQVLSFEKDT